MPVPNTRVVIFGVPRADKAFSVVEQSKATIQREAEALAKELEQEKRRIEASLRALRGR